MRLKGYKIPLDRKTKKETTSEEALKDLSYRHPEDLCLDKIRNCKFIKKGSSDLKDTYVGRDGRLHPRYSVVKTGRLAAKAPNTMNLPQGRKNPGTAQGAILKDVANAVRSSIVAPPGMELIEFDWKAIEALLVGFFANDPMYMEAAKKGVHDIFASHLLFHDKIIPAPISPLDPGFEDFVKFLKKEHLPVRDKAKKRIHAGAYGQAPKNMAKDLGITVEEVLKLDEVYKAMAPKVAKWQESTRITAHSTGQLTNPFGYTLSFWDVLSPIKGKPGKFNLGREANEALAFLPQSTCAAMLRECLVDLDAHDRHGELFTLLMPIHDSIVVGSLLGKREETVSIVVEKMQRDWPQLGGLSVEVEWKAGPSLGDMN